MTEAYVCKGSCHGVSDKPGTCQAESCEKHGQPLEKSNCSCNDAECGCAHAEGKCVCGTECKCS